MYAFTGVLVLLLPFCDAFQQPIQLLSGATSRLLPRSVAGTFNHEKSVITRFLVHIENSVS